MTDAQENTKEPMVVSDEVKEAMAKLIMRIHGGESMADIMGVDEELMDAMEYQAHRLYLAQQYEKARVAARGILALDSKRALSQMILGDVALSEFCFREAVEHLQQAHELAPDEVDIQARLGEALLKHGKKELARPHLEAVLGEADGNATTIQRCRALLENCR